MKDLLEHHSLLYSSGNSETIALLKKLAKRTKEHHPRVSSSFLKKIQKYEEEVKRVKIPSHFALCHISEEVGYGIFLKPDAPALKPGDLIGIYSGELSIALTEDTLGNSYSYDLIEELPIKKREIKELLELFPIFSQEGPFSIKTDALNKGNFTRFVNHSSFKPNVDAVIKKMPDGTLEVFLIAKKKINPGEQLLSPYGGGYWKALDIIPREITPRTYLMTKDGNVIENEKKEDPYTSKQALKYFLKFRQAIAEGEEIRSSFAKTSRNIEKEIDVFEEEVNERGISRSLALYKIPGTKEWGVFLRPDCSSIKKGSFIGVFGGKYKKVLKTKPYDNRYAYDLFSQKNHMIKVDATKEGNFTREIKHSKDPNVEAVMYEIKDGGPQVLFFAKKQIKPGEQLLIDFGKRYVQKYGKDLSLDLDSVVLKKKN